MKSIQERFLEVLHTHGQEKKCVTCEISVSLTQNLFTNMKYSETEDFSTQSLRHTLSDITNFKSEFLDYNMGCAVEAFEDILNIIHNESTSTSSCNNTCISHSYFGIQYCEEM